MVLMLTLHPLGAHATVNDKCLGDITVTAKGNKKTKHQYIESLVKNCIAEESPNTWDAIDAGKLKQCVINSRLFANVEVKINEPVIDITLDERWTLIPIPYVHKSDDKETIGGFIYESNLLGYGKGLGVGGFLSTEGNSFFLFYSDPSILFSDWTARVRARKSISELYSYYEDRKLYGTEMEESSFGLSIGHKIRSLYNLSFSSNYTERKYFQLASYQTPDDYSSINVGTRLSYAKSNYKLFYNEGISARAGFEQQVQRSDDSRMSSRLDAGMKWGKNVFRGHALQVGLKGTGSFNGDSRDSIKVGASKGFRGIERSGLWVKNTASVSLDYQIPVLRKKYGIWTIAPFLDYGVYENVHVQPNNDYISYGVGGYLYLNKISFPAIGFITGENNHFMGTFVSLSLGMSM